MHILIVEDDKILAQNLANLLATQNIHTTTAPTAEDATYYLETETYDLVILDWMLPDKSGIELLPLIHQLAPQTPIIMLTAKSQLDNKIQGLEQGADDYLTKPFEFKELLARIKAIIRRKAVHSPSSHLTLPNHIVLDLNTAQVTKNNQPVKLSPREYALLEYLALHPNQVIDRLTLLHAVWGNDADPFSNTVDVHIRYLRKKLDNPNQPSLITTVKGKGYLIKLPSDQ